MIVRKVYARLKPNALQGFTDLMEREICPWLRTQAGFQDLITLAAPDGSEVQVLTFWNNDGNAGDYSESQYPAGILKTLEMLLDEITCGRTFTVVGSTLETFTVIRHRELGHQSPDGSTVQPVEA